VQTAYVLSLQFTRFGMNATVVCLSHRYIGGSGYCTVCIAFPFYQVSFPICNYEREQSSFWRFPSHTLRGSYRRNASPNYLNPYIGHFIVSAIFLQDLCFAQRIDCFEAWRFKFRNVARIQSTTSGSVHARDEDV
jgi:hypothetical protein